MANKKIRQEINISNRGFIIAGVNLDAVEVSNSEYNDATAYFEIVAKNSYSGTYSIDLDRDDNKTFTSPTQVASISIAGPVTLLARYRSSSFSLSSTDIYYRTELNAGALNVQSARIVILQNAEEITNSTSQFEVGQYGTFVPAAVSTWYPILEPKYWKYESSKWDPTPTFYLGLTAGCADDKESYWIALQEDDGSFNWQTTYKGTIGPFSTETATYYKSSSFTPTDGRHYRLVYSSDDDKDNLYIYNAKVMAAQTDGSGISKIQTEYLLINNAPVGTGSQERYTLYDTAEWDDGDGGQPDFYHEVSSSVSETTAISQVKLVDSGGDISNSTITGRRFTKEKSEANWWSSSVAAILCYAGNYICNSQSFQSTGGLLVAVQINITKVGSPTGYAYAKLYGHSGNFGTSSVPNVSDLKATSNGVDVNYMTSGLASTIKFVFSTPYQMSNGSYYCLVIEYNGSSNSTNRLDFYRTSGSVGQGNYARSTDGSSYTSISSSDMMINILVEPTPITFVDDREIDSNIVVA